MRTARESGPLLALFGAIFGLGYGCLLIPRVGGQLSPIWLPNAVLVAVLVAAPRMRWTLGLTVGGLAILAAHLAAGSAPVRAVGLTVCNLLEVLLAAVLIVRRFRGWPDMSRIRTVVEYDVLVALAAFTGASLAAAFLWVTSGAPIGSDLLTWFTADAVGLVTVAPSLIVLASEWRERRPLDWRQGWPLLLLIAVTAAGFLQSYPFTYLIAAALMLAAYRLELAGAALGLVAVLGITVALTVLGMGPFAAAPGALVNRMLSLQIFLAAAFHMSIPLAFYRRQGRRLQARVDEALRQTQLAEAKYREIADGVLDMILQIDRGGRILYTSPSVRTLGYDPAWLLGKRGDAFVHPEDRARLLAVRDAMFAKGNAAPYRIRLRKRRGGYTWVEGRPNAICNEAGEPVLLETVFRDVNDAQAAEEALKASEARYRMLSENVSDIVACYGPDGVIRYLSPSVEAGLGYAPDELVGHPILPLLHPDDVARVGAQFAAHRQTHPPSGFRVEYRMFRKDGSLAWFEAHPRPILDPHTGEFLEWQDVVREIGGRKAMEGELRAAKQAAEAASAAKADFIANISHEIRNPLSVILTYAKRLDGRPAVDPGALKDAGFIASAARALQSLVNDLLEFSRLGAGRVSIRPRVVDPAALIRQTASLLEQQALAKGLKLSVSARPGVPSRLVIDPDRLGQILLNLIGNAVKFTEHGAVQVLVGYDAPAGRLEVDVEDTGPGLTAAQRELLFLRFSQISASDAQQAGGSGLGLAICKGLAEAMQGEIRVDSRPGQGSNFRISLPAPDASGAAAAA